MVLKTITIRQPWAGLILAGDGFGRLKDIENRTWTTAYRGRLLIHAAAQRCPIGAAAHGPGGETGMILGSVELWDIAPSDSRWALPNCHHWHLRDPLIFAELIPAKGQLGLWEFKDL